MNHNNGKTFVLVKCALLAALAVALNFVKFAPWPNGGSITAAAMALISIPGPKFWDPEFSLQAYNTAAIPVHIPAKE